ALDRPRRGTRRARTTEAAPGAPGRAAARRAWPRPGERQGDGGEVGALRAVRDGRRDEREPAPGGRSRGPDGRPRGRAPGRPPGARPGEEAAGGPQAGGSKTQVLTSQLSPAARRRRMQRVGDAGRAKKPFVGFGRNTRRRDARFPWQAEDLAPRVRRLVDALRRSTERTD